MYAIRFSKLAAAHHIHSYKSAQHPISPQTPNFPRTMAEDKNGVKLKPTNKQCVWQSPSEDPNLRDRLHLYNSITRKKDLFIPIQSNLVTWYSCGPTVYDSSHMGHARTYLSLDILRRVLSEYFGYNILYVMNITDIDDKIIKRGRSRHLFQEYLSRLAPEGRVAFRDDTIASQLLLEERYNAESDPDKKKMLKKMLTSLEQTLLEAQQLIKSPDCKKCDLERLATAAEYALSEYLDRKLGASLTDHSIFQKLSRCYEEEFHQDMEQLGVAPPDVLTRVSDHVPEIVSFIKTLVEKGYAYESKGSVYFNTSHFHASDRHQYAKLMPEAAQNLDQLQEGEGELTSAEEKRASQDFVLWKASKPGEPFWSSPWGEGRPGWHIECSAMATEILGDRMDIHSGGVDLKFPHHDNEIAQTEAFYESDQWINYFLHTGHLTIDGCKMSKSLKNFVTIRDALKKHSASQLRIFFLLHAWDSVLDYSSRALEEAQTYEASVKNFFLSLRARLQQLRERGGVKWRGAERGLQAELSETQTQLHRALCDSVNTGWAMRLLRELISRVNVYISEADTAHRPIDSPLLLKTGSYLFRLYQILGVVPSTKHGFMTAPLYPGAELSDNRGDESMIMPLALLIAEFRHEVRKQARTSRQNEILGLCDRLRDEQLVEAGIQLEDKSDTSQNPYVVKLRRREDILAEREEKIRQQEEKTRDRERQKQIMKENQLKAEAQRKIPPNEMFKTAEEIEKYSAFDERGIPTHYQDGTDIQGKQKKSLQNAYDQQRKKHEKYLAEQSTASS